MIVWPHDLRAHVSDSLEVIVTLVDPDMPCVALCDTCGSESSEAMIVQFDDLIDTGYEIFATTSHPRYLAVFGMCGHVRSSWSVKNGWEPIFSLKMKDIEDSTRLERTEHINRPKRRR